MLDNELVPGVIDDVPVYSSPAPVIISATLTAEVEDVGAECGTEEVIHEIQMAESWNDDEERIGGHPETEDEQSNTGTIMRLVERREEALPSEEGGVVGDQGEPAQNPDHEGEFDLTTLKWTFNSYSSWEFSWTAYSIPCKKCCTSWPMVAGNADPLFPRGPVGCQWGRRRGVSGHRCLAVID